MLVSEGMPCFKKTQNIKFELTKQKHYDLILLCMFSSFVKEISDTYF